MLYSNKLRSPQPEPLLQQVNCWFQVGQIHLRTRQKTWRPFLMTYRHFKSWHESLLGFDTASVLTAVTVAEPYTDDGNKLATEFESPKAAWKSAAPVVDPSRNSVVLVTTIEPGVAATLTTWTLYPAAFKGLSIADMNCSKIFFSRLTSWQSLHDAIGKAMTYVVLSRLVKSGHISKAGEMYHGHDSRYCCVFADGGTSAGWIGNLCKVVQSCQ